MAERPAGHCALVRQLYEEHVASLYRYAVMLMADATAAEDVVQQVFTSLLRHPRRIDNPTHYLRRAVRNECYSQLRERQRAALDHEARLLESVEPTDMAPDERIALERAIRDLSIEQREVVHLHVFEGWTFQQIADASDMSINTITARYRYALEKLRRILTRYV